ncbi:hypothetical protein [Paenibacillus cremeus]|nr:hypothetical protein [Paenibacillus cremeus]
MKELMQQHLKDRALTAQRLIEELKKVCHEQDRKMTGLDANLATLGTIIL